MLYAVVFSVVEALLVWWIWFRNEVFVDRKGKAENVLSLGVFILAAVMNLLLFCGQYSILKCFNLMMVFTILVIAAGIDYKKYLIPNKLIAAGLAGRLVLLVAEAAVSSDTVRQSVLLSGAGLVLGLFLMLFLTLITRRGIGYGDVKLYAWLGFCVGITDAYYVLFYSVLFAALYGAFLLLFKKADGKKKLPFAPFIFMGCYVVFVMSLLRG
ncbi:MAG: A24 family peptidase [Eubacterium sp.]|nr:A24 family peptidase [Eubacterium sp.]